MNASSHTRLSMPERLLRTLADVRPGEGRSALLMFLNIFLLLTAYYVLKSVRDGLMVGGSSLTIGETVIKGDQLKIYTSVLMGLLLVVIVPAYSRLASRVSRIRLINTCVTIVIVCLLAFFVWGRAAGAGLTIGMSFYVWLGIINVFLISQFWSFANDVYRKEQGERLFAIVALGQSLGAIIGALVAGVLEVSIFLLFAVSAAVLFLCLLLYNVLDRRFRLPILTDELATTPTSAGVIAKEAEPLSSEGAFKLVFRTRYLLLIALMLLANNLVNTTGEYIHANAAERHISAQVPNLAAADEILRRIQTADEYRLTQRRDPQSRIQQARSEASKRFYGRFYALVSTVGAVIQAFFVSRILKYLGIRLALFILPLVAFGGYASIGLIGGMFILRLAKTAENSVDYSLQNTVKQAVFLVTSRAAKYKAKAAIDTAFVRFGDAAAGGIVLLGLHVFGLQARGFAFVNVLICLLWMLLSAGIGREHQTLARPQE